MSKRSQHIGRRQCHNESNAPHTAARCLEKAALIASDVEKAKLAMESADTWAMAGEPLRGAEVALKLAASLDADAARQLVAKATDLASTSVGSPHAPELLQKVVGYYCSKGHYREALQANDTLLEALDRARMSEGAPLYRCLAAQTILALADGSDVQKPTRLPRDVRRDGSRLQTSPSRRFITVAGAGRPSSTTPSRRRLYVGPRRGAGRGAAAARRGCPSGAAGRRRRFDRGRRDGRRT